MGLSLVFWVMLWASLNTDPTRILGMNNLLDLFHGLRAYLVLLAAYLVVLIILMRRSFSLPLFRGPLWLIMSYSLVGVIASLLLSPKPAIALYWAAAHLSVLVVLALIVSGANSLACIRQVINLNWLIVGALSLALFAVSWDVIFTGGLRLRDTGEFQPGYLVSVYKPEVFGMPMVRATGISRFAAVLGIVALCRLWYSRRVWRLSWMLLLLFSLVVLFLFQARGAIVAFMTASFLVLVLHLGVKAKVVLPAAAVLLLVVVWAFGFPQSLWQYLARGQSLDSFIYQMSGRRETWEAGWELFQQSPLLGFGFHADRFLLGGQQMHNSFFHALVQTGILGTTLFVGAFASAWIWLFRSLKRRTRMPSVERAWLIETAGVLSFLTVLSISQSTGAFYGVEWLLLAPLVAHIQILGWSKTVYLAQQSLQRMEAAVLSWKT
jgi:O-antigen ligase